METFLKVILIIALVILSLLLLFCIYLAGASKGYDQAVNDCIDCLYKVEKEHEKTRKVLEIIKDKKVNVANFIQWLEAKEDKATYEQYLFDCVQEGWFIHPNDGVVKEFPGLFLQTCEKLTKEEFNLLKGWLSK